MKLDWITIVAIVVIVLGAAYFVMKRRKAS
jgi:LPXTG-motif cell wall-anchored protein